MISGEAGSVVRSPVGGRALPLRDVPDPVFAAALVGPGTAIDPTRRGRVIAVSPVDGTIIKLLPHAFIVQTADRAGVLVHLGIDTIELAGKGFELLVSEGARLAAGADVVEWDPALVESGGHSAICPVVALDADASALSNVRESGVLTAGDPLFTWAR